VRAGRPRGATLPSARSGEVDAKHAQLLSAFMAATQAGDLNALTQLLASDVRIVTYVVRNSDKLRHLAAAARTHERGRG
jgi:hypothetical protein